MDDLSPFNCEKKEKQDTNDVLLQIIPDQFLIITDQADDVVSRSSTIANAAPGVGASEKAG
jgi:hypothetical protein